MQVIKVTGSSEIIKPYCQNSNDRTMGSTHDVITDKMFSPLNAEVQFNGQGGSV